MFRIRHAVIAAVLGLLAAIALAQPPDVRPPARTSKPPPRDSGPVEPIKRPREMRVTFAVPEQSLFVGSYVKVPIAIEGVVRPNLTDFEFRVREGAPGGVVSLSRDSEFTPAHPDIMLCAGYAPGKYTLEALKKGTKTVVGESPFVITDLWREKTNGPDGPPLWFTGTDPGYGPSPAWGGGPGVPQNLNVMPATGTRRLAILLVDTSTQRYTTNATALQAIRDRWSNEAAAGASSTRQFYRQMSSNQFDISADVFGPVHLSGTWDDYFRSDRLPVGTSYYQACVTAGDPLIDYNNFDTLVCVSCSVSTSKYAWPCALRTPQGPFTTAHGSRALGIISMPHDWGTAGGPSIHATLSHEFGHTLSLPDEYTPAAAGRNLGNWGLMDFEYYWPYLTLVERMQLGWVSEPWLQTFNFASMAAPVDQTVTLSPVEKGAPAPGRRAGIEIRIADGWNYYLEYRSAQSGQLGDQQLPVNPRLLGTDVISSLTPPWISAPYPSPLQRPAVLLLSKHPGDNGAVLTNGQFYTEVDRTDPVYPTDFRIDVSGADATKADVRIRYGVSSKPDPSIRPWPAGPDRRWQSPDIEVRNARSAADPAWLNVPWVGHANTVVAKVKNAGALAAPGVVTNFFVKDFTVGGAPETFLGSDTHNIAPGATVEFQTQWVPPGSGHYCIVARIPLYQTPTNPPVVEMTELNNVAQSNYDRFISASASPASREIRTVAVGNPLNRRARVFLTVNQSNPLYRTYLEHTDVVLDPGQTKKVRVMVEYTGEGKPQVVEKYRKVPNDVNAVAFVEDVVRIGRPPRQETRAVYHLLGGAQFKVATGRATEFKAFTIGDGVRGTVVTADDGKPVPGGNAIVMFTPRTGAKPQETYQTVPVVNGNFSANVPGGAGTLQAYYVPPSGYGDCTSQRVDRKGDK
jgi:hypothetical protein